MKRIFLPLVSTAFALMAAITFMSPAAASIDINFSDQNTYTISQVFYGPAIASEDVEFSFKSDAEHAPLSFAQLASETPSLIQTKASRSIYSQIATNGHQAFQITSKQMVIPLRI